MQMINFLLLLVLLRLVAYKPLLKVLEERQKYVANTIAQAENQRAEAEKIKAEYEAEMRRAREQAQAIIERATKAGEEQAQEIIAQAKAEAERVKESALADIQREREKAIAELRDQVASLALLVAGKVIREGLDARAHERLIQDAVKEVGQLPC
ncbi:MAG: F0F1 ATP synthase subunit B [Bacillota bacterium]